MLPYLILLTSNVTVALLSVNNKKIGKTVYFWFTVLSLTLFSGLRGIDVGADTQAYYSIFDAVSKLNTFPELLARREEIGYVVLNKLVALMGGNATVVLIISAFITSYGLMLYIKNNSCDMYYSGFLLITFMFFFTSMNVVRQYIATGICINIITLLKDNKYFKSVILVCIGVLFHKLAILFIALPITKLMLKNNVTTVIFYIALFFVAVFSKEIILTFAKLVGYDSYMNNMMPDQGVYNIILFTCIAIFVLYSCIRKDGIYEKYRYNIAIFFILYTIIVMAKIAFEWANRIAWLFSTTVVVLIPNLFKEYTKTDETIMRMGIAIISVMFFMYGLFTDWQGIMPYIPIWRC